MNINTDDEIYFLNDKGVLKFNPIIIMEYLKWLNYFSKKEIEQINKVSEKSIYELSSEEIKDLKRFNESLKIIPLLKQYLLNNCSNEDMITVNNYIMEYNIEDIMKSKLDDEEIKRYLNKAMDLYSTIEFIDINATVKESFSTETHQLTKLDKRILSLFIAGFIVDGNLKEILEEYDDIKLQDLLSFANISEKEIHKLNEDEYSNFYNKHFKLELVNIIKEWMYGKKVNYISPEVIVNSLEYSHVTKTKVLDYFWNEYDVNGMFPSDHLVFKTLENHNLIKGSKSCNDSSNEFKSSNKSDFLFRLPLDKNIITQPSEDVDEQNLPTNDFYDESIWKLLDDILKKFIGQETLVEHLFYNIVNNQKLAGRDDVSDGERSIIFIDGPTGTGKTAITREITDKLDIPFTSSSITNYSSTGYVGGNITDTLKDLYKKSNGDISKAERGIIVFDEFDKIAYNQVGGLEMKRAVQQQLLDFMGGGKYKISYDMGLFGSSQIEFDTSKLTFVCLGALTNLRDKKTEVKNSIGFGETNISKDNSIYSISPQDLIDLGLERELVGRFNTYLHSEEYSKETLLRILRESTISPMLGFKKWIDTSGKTLEIEDGVEELIAEEAYKLNTGARSLQTIINNIRTPFIKEVLRGKESTIYLDLNTITRINDDTKNRKARM